MSEAPFALSTIPPQPVAAEGDFDAICETVKASERGRWFLEEYARRNRNADTAQVLAAIGRIEGVVRDSRDREAYQSVRADLLDMARTIAVTRADVAESKVEAAPEVKSESEPPAAAGSDVFTMAERIQDVAWTMRERGLDPRTCEQIEALARTILSATSLRNPNDSARASSARCCTISSAGSKGCSMRSPRKPRRAKHTQMLPRRLRWSPLSKPRPMTPDRRR
jgi:hypothetical protein